VAGIDEIADGAHEVEHHDLEDGAACRAVDAGVDIADDGGLVARRPQGVGDRGVAGIGDEQDSTGWHRVPVLSRWKVPAEAGGC
jgi:hypothetical protein